MAIQRKNLTKIKVGEKYMAIQRESLRTRK